LASFQFPKDLASRQAQEWPEDFSAERRVNSAQATRAAATQQAQQHRFRLVTGRVAGHYFVQPAAVDQRKKEAVASLSGGSLKIAPLRNLLFAGRGRASEEFNSKFRCQRADEALVRLRFLAAQLVIEMDNGERQSRLARELPREMKKQNGIRPTRNRHADAFAGAKKTALLQFLRPSWIEVGPLRHGALLRQRAL
jgi:hypothetical protein